MSLCITWRGAKALFPSLFVSRRGGSIFRLLVFNFGAGGGSGNCVNHRDVHHEPEALGMAWVGGLDGKFVMRVGRHGFCRAFCDDSPSAYMLNNP